jgi:hypothetical protein
MHGVSNYTFLLQNFPTPPDSLGYRQGQSREADFRGTKGIRHAPGHFALS